jgi:hypothetical protein
VIGLNQLEVRDIIEREIETILDAFTKHGKFTPRISRRDRDPGLSKTDKRRDR